MVFIKERGVVKSLSWKGLFDNIPFVEYIHRAENIFVLNPDSVLTEYV